MWQQVVVYAILVVAGAITVWSGISAWRAIRRGECGHCPGCNGEPADASSVPTNAKERLVFLPADDLRRSAARGQRNRLSGLQ
jgi:hypothetical protein